MTDTSLPAVMTTVDRAHAALVSTLAGASTFAGLKVRLGEVLGDDLDDDGDTKRWLNVLIAPGPPIILSEMMGLGEAEAVVEYVQVFHIEWMVQRENAAARTQAFQVGMLAISDALSADRKLAGTARGLTVGGPDRESNSMPFTPTTMSAVIPVRVQLRGRDTLS